MPDAQLAALRATADAGLGIDDGFLEDAMNAFGRPPAATPSRAAHQGTFHRLFELHGDEGDRRLLRVAASEGEAPASLMRLECGVMNALRERGFAVPRCDFRAVRRGDSLRGAHLLARVEGRSLTSLDDDEPRMGKALGWVARFLATLHAVHGTGYGPLSLDAYEQARREATNAFRGVHARWPDYVLVRLAQHVGACVAQGAIAQSEAEAIASRFAAAREGLLDTPSALLHGDPGSHNFIVDDEGIRAVIDWEDALLGDPLFDLASLCTFHPERRHAAIWSSYGVELAPGGAPWMRFWLYFLRIALAKTVHRHRFGYEDRPGRAPASGRIRLALARLAQGG